GDIVLGYCFWSEGAETMIADYNFKCISTGEQFEERHELRVANVGIVTSVLSELGFSDIVITDSWRGEPFSSSISPFVVARLSD
ncbi:class I SAM-dependent methyltransferase, partial [Salmonella enterica subsp. enterica]|nr:class I SAM-dependent methyltransferase [Salmonella enterica subsp. enterica serovar Javiana]